MQRLTTNIEDLISNYVKAEINANQNRQSILLGSFERLTELKTDEFVELSKPTAAPLSPCQPFKLTDSPAMTEFALSMNDKTVEEIGPNPILFSVAPPPQLDASPDMAEFPEMANSSPDSDTRQDAQLDPVIRITLSPSAMTKLSVS